MTRFAAFFFVALLPFATLAAEPVATQPAPGIPSGTYKLDKTHTSVTWKVGHMGLSFYTARFTEMDATLELDVAKPENSKLTATVNPRSVKTDYVPTAEKDFDKELAEGADWFDAGKFPTVTFTSKKVTMTGEKTAKVEGDLTFRGVTKPLTLDVTMNGMMPKHPFTQGPVIGFSAVGMLKRSDFGMTYGTQYLGDAVQVLIETEFMGPTPPPMPAKP